MPKGGDSDVDKNVLSPEELDIEAREEVAPIGDDRYVIGSDGSPDVPEDAETSEASESTGDTDDATGSAAEDSGAAGDESDDESATARSASRRNQGLSGGDVKRWLDEELAQHDSAYAYRIAAKSGGSVNHQQLATDDIDTAFDGLLVWYTRQVAEGSPVDEALGILLAESSIKVRYPTEQLRAYLDAHDLDPEDSIQDLVDTVVDEDGLVFPNRD